MSNKLPGWFTSRTFKIDGVRLHYPLSEWQRNIALEEAAESDGTVTWAEAANELAHDFSHADLMAEYIIDVIKRSRPSFGLGLIRSMIEDGSIDAFTIYSLVEEAARKSESAKQASAIAKRHAPGARKRAWVTERWNARGPGEFKTRDAFVDWCRSNCPGGIDVSHERVRDKWLPGGEAVASGDRYRTR